MIENDMGYKTRLKICAYPSCEKEFKALYPNSVYCSKKCRHAHKLDKYKETKGAPRDCGSGVCSGCGIEFVKNTPTHLYCTKECLHLYFKLKNSDKQKGSYFKIFERDGFACVYCGKSSIEDKVKLEVDHVYPVKHGGEEDVFNLVTSCSLCNGKKLDKVLYQSIILRIWKRNMRLSLDAGLDFKDLKEKFEKLTFSRPSRINRLKQVEQENVVYLQRLPKVPVKLT